MAFTVLDRQSIIPFYYQIQQYLLGQIRSGELKAGSAVPSEHEIAAAMGVSRMTARQALKSLCSLGVAYSRRGKGTYVSRIKLEKNFRQVLSFSEEMRARGSRPRSRVLAFKRIRPSSEVAKALLLSPGEAIVFLRRVRLADTVPMGVEAAHLPCRMYPGLLQQFDPRSSLYQFLAKHFGVRINLADEIVEAGLATAEEARRLRIPVKSPVFLFTRTAYLQTGEPVEYVKSTYRGDRYKLVNLLKQESAVNPDGPRDEPRMQTHGAGLTLPLPAGLYSRYAIGKTATSRAPRKDLHISSQRIWSKKGG